MCEPKVMDKIRKLLALSESPNEGEASNAMSKVQMLLLQHELTLDEITDVEETAIEELALTEDRPGVAKWEQYLMGGISQALNCKMIQGQKYVMGKRGKPILRHKFTAVGYSSDVKVAMYLYDYLKKTVVNLANQEIRNYFGRDGRPREVYRESYLYGVVVSIISKVKQKFAETITNEEINALVRRKDLKVQQYLDDNMNLRKSKARAGKMDFGARLKGEVDGSKVSINKPMENGVASRQGLIGA